jgi:hypothetical protein
MPSCFCSLEPPTYTSRKGRVFALRRRGFVRRVAQVSCPIQSFSCFSSACDLLPLVESQRVVVQSMQSG